MKCCNMVLRQQCNGVTAHDNYRLWIINKRTMGNIILMENVINYKKPKVSNWSFPWRSFRAALMLKNPSLKKISLCSVSAVVPDSYSRAGTSRCAQCGHWCPFLGLKPCSGYILSIQNGNYAVEAILAPLANLWKEVSLDYNGNESTMLLPYQSIYKIRFFWIAR